MSRFSLFHDSILDHASRVKIDLHKIKGRIAIDFEIEGTLGPHVFDDGDDGDQTALDDKPDPVAFARSLFAQFVASARGGAT